MLFLMYEVIRLIVCSQRYCIFTFYFCVHIILYISANVDDVFFWRWQSIVLLYFITRVRSVWSPRGSHRASWCGESWQEEGDRLAAWAWWTATIRCWVSWAVAAPTSWAWNVRTADSCWAVAGRMGRTRMRTVRIQQLAMKRSGQRNGLLCSSVYLF